MQSKEPPKADHLLRVDVDISPPGQRTRQQTTRHSERQHVSWDSNDSFAQQEYNTTTMFQNSVDAHELAPQPTRPEHEPAMQMRPAATEDRMEDRAEDRAMDPQHNSHTFQHVNVVRESAQSVRHEQQPEQAGGPRHVQGGPQSQQRQDTTQSPPRASDDVTQPALLTSRTESELSERLDAMFANSKRFIMVAAMPCSPLSLSRFCFHLIYISFVCAGGA